MKAHTSYSRFDVSLFLYRAIGLFGFTVAEVGGKARNSGCKPGINSATAFCRDRAFLGGVGRMKRKKEENVPLL